MSRGRMLLPLAALAVMLALPASAAAALHFRNCEVVSTTYLTLGWKFFAGGRLSIDNSVIFGGVSGALRFYANEKLPERPAPLKALPVVDDQLAAIVRLKPRVLSFTFGMPSPAQLARMHEAAKSAGPPVSGGVRAPDGRSFLASRR